MTVFFLVLDRDVFFVIFFIVLRFNLTTASLNDFCSSEDGIQEHRFIEQIFEKISTQITNQYEM